MNLKGSERGLEIWGVRLEFVKSSRNAGLELTWVSSRGAVGRNLVDSCLRHIGDDDCGCRRSCDRTSNNCKCSTRKLCQDRKLESATELVRSCQVELGLQAVTMAQKMLPASLRTLGRIYISKLSLEFVHLRFRTSLLVINVFIPRRRSVSARVLGHMGC